MPPHQIDKAAVDEELSSSSDEENPFADRVDFEYVIRVAAIVSGLPFVTDEDDIVLQREGKVVGHWSLE